MKKLLLVSLMITGLCASEQQTSKNVGLLIVATGRYIEFVSHLISSARHYFCKNHRVTYFVFTDANIVADQDDVIILPYQQFGWPYDALVRCCAYLKYQHHLSAMDYLFAGDADLLFVNEISDEILSESVGVLHAAFIGKSGSPETRQESCAYLDPAIARPYFAAGFYGGSAKQFLQQAAGMKDAIEQDLRHDIIAIWHDESYLNRYFADHPPTKILSPSYCFPDNPVHIQLWNIGQLTPRIIALTKDHNAYRVPMSNETSR